jgi:hypothetical protein
MRTREEVIGLGNMRLGNRYESGELYTYTILKATILDGRGSLNYRVMVDLDVQVGDKESVLYKGVMCSSLLSYRIIKDMERYIKIPFYDFNTSSDYDNLPFKFVISSDNQHYYLFLVNERKSVQVDVLHPDGSRSFVWKNRYWSPKDYVRFIKLTK